MTNAFIRKLEAHGPFSAADRALLEQISRKWREVSAGHDLIRMGDAPDEVRLILDGFACRAKYLKNGKRQIVDYLIPGDFCDLHVIILKRMDHDITALSRCVVVDIPRARISEMLERPALAKALWWATLVNEATLREWLVNIGQRSAPQRLAHLFCELYIRLRAVGLVSESSFALPVTQKDLADTAGLSEVHVNRSLQILRQKRLITLKSRELVVLDAPGLIAFCGFDPNYLHIGEDTAVNDQTLM